MSVFGIKYLSRGRPAKGLYSVKIEIGCHSGKHGKTEYFYEGNNYDLAVKIANKVNQLMIEGGQSKALEWKDYDMNEEVKEWKAQHR